MKISLEWLSQYLPGPLMAEQAGEALTHGGFPVEVFEKHGDDDVIDVEVTSNRGDCLCHVGVARELAALLGREFKFTQPKITESSPSAASVTGVRIESAELCPHYTARILRNVTVGPSPAWMVRRLEAVGLRSINNVVDITNYVMFELGQPLHAFDFDKIAEKQIIVRAARAGESIVSLDGHERALTPGMLVICDATKPVALAGIMGGRDSEVSTTTTSVLLEAARFDPLSIRKTARSLAMKSDSSYRFERGIDPQLPYLASERAAQLMCELAGATLLEGYVEDGSSGPAAKRIDLRLARATQLLGVALPTGEILSAFEKLQLCPSLKGDRIEVTVPSFRLDLNIEVDLVEEAARVIGYDRIPMHDEISIRLTPPALGDLSIATIRGQLVASGFFETVTVTFIPDAIRDAFLPPGILSTPRADAIVRKADAHLRPSVLPSLLEVVRRNESSGVADAHVFEIGSTFWNDADGKVVEKRQVGIVGGSDVRTVRGAVESLLKRLDANRAIKIKPDKRSGFTSGACGKIEWGGEAIGWIGLVDKSVRDAIDLRSSPAAAELFLSPLVANTQHIPQLKPLPRYPSVRRDVSFIVAESVRYQQIEELIHSLALDGLEAIEFVTTYRGKPLEKGTKSVTITLIFRSPTTTLTSEQVESAVSRATEACKSQLGATLRV